MVIWVEISQMQNIGRILPFDSIMKVKIYNDCFHLLGGDFYNFATQSTAVQLSPVAAPFHIMKLLANAQE